MKTTIVVLILSVSLMSWFAGCASTPDKTDDSHIRHHSDDSFKELQKEENRY